MSLVIGSNTKENFLWESEKINLKFSCVRCRFVKFDIYFLGLQKEIFFGVITDD